MTGAAAPLLTPCCQQARVTTLAASGHSRRDACDNQGKVPLRQHAILGERDTRRCDALYLLIVLEARCAMGVLHSRAISPDVASRKRRDLSVAKPHRKASFLRKLRLRHLFGIAGLVD